MQTRTRTHTRTMGDGRNSIYSLAQWRMRSARKSSPCSPTCARPVHSARRPMELFHSRRVSVAAGPVLRVPPRLITGRQPAGLPHRRDLCASGWLPSARSLALHHHECRHSSVRRPVAAANQPALTERTQAAPPTVCLCAFGSVLVAPERSLALAAHATRARERRRARSTPLKSRLGR